MGGHAEKIGARKPEYFLMGALSAGASFVKRIFAENEAEIAGGAAGMTREAANRILENDAITDTLLSQMRPPGKNTAFYVIFGAALLLILIVVIIIFLRK